MNRRLNILGLCIAKSLELPQVGGSDAHSALNVGKLTRLFHMLSTGWKVMR